MAVVISPDSELGKELARWDTPQRLGGMKPDGYEPYPKMLYKAHLREDGRAVCLEAPPSPHKYTNQQEFDRAALLSDHFNRSCTRVVHSDGELAIAKGQGWRDTPSAALAALEQEQQAIGTAAAEVNAAVARMSAQAKAEHQAATDAVSEHVVDVVGTKRGPKPRTE